MKILILFVLIINLYASDLKVRIEKLVEVPPKEKVVHANYDPFQNGKEIVMRTLETKIQTKALRVTTILNNRVFIDSRWYKLGDTVQGYKIMQITKNNILAKKSDKVIKLGIKKSQKLLKIRDKKQ